MLTVRSTINIASQTVPPIIPVVQGDTGRAILFTLADFTIPAGATATYYVQKPSGEAVYNNATIDGNNVLVELTAQSIIEKGDNYGQVRITVGEEVVTSFDFILLVKEFRGIDAVQSLTEMNIFDKAVEQASEAIDEVKTDALEAIDDAKDEAIEEVTSNFDLKLDASSTKGVQNQVITQAINTVNNAIGDLSGETVTPTATNNYGVGGNVGQVIETWATTEYWHGIYTVSAGNTYGITTVSDFPQQIVVWFTNSSNVILEIHKAFATDHVEMVCTAPTGATKLFVMSYGYDAYHGTVQKVEPLSETVSNLKEDLSNIAETEKWNLLEDVVPIDRTFLNADGTTRTNNGTFYFDKVPVEANTVYYFFNEEIANSYSANGYDSKYCARTVLFYDTDGQLIEDGVTYSTYTRSPITTPSNCKYMSICGAYLNGAFDSGIGVNWLTTKAIDKHEDVTYIIASVPIETVTSLNSELNTINNALERLNNVSVQLPNRKPTFAFIFDDGTNGDVNTKALFDSYGFKCGFALVAENYGNTDLQALKDRYLPYQSEGFEILSHSVNGTAFDSLTDLSIAESYLKESISKLMSWGFDVRGWVTPSTWLLAEQLPLVEKYYQYGYGHLGGTAEGTAYHQFVGLDIRQLDRWGLEGHTVEQTLAKIDEAIANNAYMILYGHSYPGADNNMTEANMATILSYLKTKADNGEVMVGTPRETINHYYSFRHSDLLDLIDRITI